MADPTTVPTGIQPNLPAALSELGAALLLPALLIAVIAYFCGCFNGAVIVSKYILRDDVRTHGSGNAGLTNFYRTFGGPLTFVVILTDVLKAVVAVWAGILAAKYLVADELLVVALGKYWAGSGPSSAAATSSSRTRALPVPTNRPGGSPRPPAAVRCSIWPSAAGWPACC